MTVDVEQKIAECFARLKSYNDQARMPGKPSYKWQILVKDPQVGIGGIYNTYKTKKEAIEACDWLNMTEGNGLYYTIRKADKENK